MTEQQELEILMAAYSKEELARKYLTLLNRIYKKTEEQERVTEHELDESD